MKTLSKQTLQTREYLHLIAAYQQFLGTETSFFEQSPDSFPYRPSNSKLTFLWEKMHQHDIRLQSKLFWLPKSDFDNDEAIMDTIRANQAEFQGTPSFLNPQMVQNSNTVRLYLKCTFASDLMDPRTNDIHAHLYEVTAPQTTSEEYPFQPRPSDVAINDWKRCIRLAFISGNRHMPIPLIEKP